MPQDLASLRLDYVAAGLDEADLAPTWWEQFSRWFEQAAGLREPNAMVLATVGDVPSARTVLLKGMDQRGFTFFTNRTSRKGTELATHPHACLVFPWIDLERQVVITGTVAVIEQEETDAYFRSRPRGAQLAAWASHQSAPLSDRGTLTQRFADLEARFADAEVPVPPFWAGHRLTPDSVEFWQGRPSRLHDRLRYRFDGVWLVERLSP